MAVKNAAPVSRDSLGSDDRSRDVSAILETRRCRVSGIRVAGNTANPIKVIPSNSGIHSERGMRADATGGAISSARSPAHRPNRNKLALELLVEN
jgi:hypothetical protein